MAHKERKDMRRAVFGGAFVEFEERSDIVGMVIDINRHGLAFTYRGDAAEGLGFTSLCADICVPENGFILDEVHCRVVYDIVPDGSGSPGPADGPVEKKCGLAFEELTETQREGLEFLIHCLAREAGRDPG